MTSNKISEGSFDKVGAGRKVGQYECTKEDYSPIDVSPFSLCSGGDTGEGQQKTPFLTNSPWKRKINNLLWSLIMGHDCLEDMVE